MSFAHVAVLVVALAAPDPEAAERQYRLAQRLGADGSPDAAAAFEKVVALAPAGPYADDALVDLARWSGACEWPEEVGDLDAARAARARAPLEKAVTSYPGGDRALEARYRLALLRLAPLPGRDAVRAREDLIAVAGSVSRERWPAAARYVLGILDEQSGARDRADGAFARIIVERPGSDVAARAKAGFARGLLVAGRFGEAASWLQEAVEGGAPGVVGAAAHRELALREISAERLTIRRWQSVTAARPTILTAKGASLLTVSGDGRVLVFDRKNDVLQSFDAKGPAGAALSLPEVTALASDPFGRAFAATKDGLVRLDRSRPVTVFQLGAYGAPSAIAVEASGAVWIVDRRGDRVARWTIGAPAPTLVYESKGAGMRAIVLSAGRAIVLEEKNGRVLALTPAGVAAGFGSATFRRPIALSADAAGRIAVLDEKAETVTRLDASGRVTETLSTVTRGLSRPAALAVTEAGSVMVLDAATGAVATLP